MLMFGTNMHIINKTKKLLPTHFEMKGMGEGLDVTLALNDFLGISKHSLGTVLRIGLQCFEAKTEKTNFK